MPYPLKHIGYLGTDRFAYAYHEAAHFSSPCFFPRDTDAFSDGIPRFAAAVT
jgi:hypothetical protein